MLLGLKNFSRHAVSVAHDEGVGFLVEVYDGQVPPWIEQRAQPKGSTMNLLFYELSDEFIFSVFFFSELVCYLLFQFAHRNLVLQIGVS